MPRFTSSPASWPSPTFGRMPAAITTRSAAMLPPPLNCSALHPPVSENRGSARSQQYRNAQLVHLGGLDTHRQWGPVAVPSANPSDGQRSPRNLALAVRGRLPDPSRPPPITTAFSPGRSALSKERVSSRLRKTKTPSFFTSSIGGISGTLPVASRSLSNLCHTAVIPGNGLSLANRCRQCERPDGDQSHSAGTSRGR